MINYYVELGLDRSASIEQLEQELKQQKKKWTGRASNAADTEKRQHAERMVDLIREASETLLVKEKKTKYDKELDKNPAAANAKPTIDAPQTQTPASDNVSGDALVDLVEQFYDSSNYNQAIAVAKKAIATGNISVDLYRILALCYYERGDNSGAYSTLKEMMRLFPDDSDAHYYYARMCLEMLDGHTEEAKTSIDWILNNDPDREGIASALDVEYSLKKGEISLAEKKVQEYLAKNNNDPEFRQFACMAFAAYADTELTEYGGDYYFAEESDFNNWLNITEKALAIYPDKDLQKVYDQNKEFKSKTYVPGSWMGILCGVGYTLAGFSSGLIGVGVIALIFTVGITYYSFAPKWMLLRFNYTQRLSGLHEVARIINWLFSLALRIGWAIFQFILEIAFGI